MKLIFTPVLLSLLLGPALVVSLVVSVSTGCNSPNAAFCDISASCNAASDLTFCDIDGVYPGSSAPNECIVPPAVDACNRVMPCAGGLLCSDDAMGTCVACQLDSDCSDGNQGLNFCNTDNTCVACLLDEQCTEAAAPICAQEVLACRGCAENTECGSGLCGVLRSGECVSESDILYVATSGTLSSLCGAKDMPCALITDALDAVTPTRNIIMVGEGQYSKKLSIVGKAVTLIADGDVIIKPVLSGTENLLEISGNSNVTLVGFTLTASNNAPSTGMLSCVGPSSSLSLTGTAISRSSSDGINSDKCDLELNRCDVHDNDGGGIVSSGGTLRIRDSKVRNNTNGGQAIYKSGVAILAGGMLDMQDSEVFDNGGVAIQLDDGALLIGNSMIHDNAGIGIVLLGGSLDLQNSKITDNRGQNGIFCSSAAVDILSSRIVNSGRGISVSDSPQFNIERSRIANNEGGGIELGRSSYRVINNMIVNNGTSSSNFAGIKISRTADKDETFDFNTVAGNWATSNGTHAIRCSGSNLVAKNNIFSLAQGATAETLIDGCDTRFSLISSDSTGNSGNHMNTVWANPSFQDAASGDFHLVSGSPGINAASFQATLDIDIDGDARPKGDRRDIGADEAE